MNYIWDIVIKAKQNGIKADKLFFKQGKDVSPWYEQSFSSINQNEVDDSKIEINSLYRFNDLFGKYLHEGFLENIEFKEKFFDLVIHFLSEIDLAKGISKESIYLLQLEEEIDNGVLLQLKLGSSLYNFRQALKNIYPDVLLYQIKEKPHRILIYLGIKKTDKQVRKIKFINDMFLPIEYNVRMFWENHFGVGGVEVTLNLDEIELL